MQITSDTDYSISNVNSVILALFKVRKGMQHAKENYTQSNITRKGRRMNSFLYLNRHTLEFTSPKHRWFKRNRIIVGVYFCSEYQMTTAEKQNAEESCDRQLFAA